MRKKEVNNERFEKVYSNGRFTPMEIWVDKETGVNYLFHQAGYAGGLTVMVDADGKPIVTPINKDFTFE